MSMPHLETMDILEITETDIQNLVGRSENQLLEFKSQEIDGYKFAKVVSGFANAKGGYIVIGAHEDEHGVCNGFVSLSRPGVVKQSIQQVIRDYTDEPVQGIDTRDVRLATGENLLLVYIPESNRKPHAIKKQGDRLLQFWIRNGSHKVEMKLNEVRNAFLESAGVLDLLSGSDLPHEEDRLSDLEEEIMLGAFEDEGSIRLFTGAGGMADWLVVGKKTYRDDDDPSIAALARDALEKLETRNMVRHERGVLYKLTGEGFTLAKGLKSNQI